MKAFTDIEQSKKLAEILPLESADMLFQFGEDKCADSIRVPLTKEHWEQMMPDIIPCWSLAALLNILHFRQDDIPSLSGGGYKNGNYIPDWCLDYECNNGDYQKTFADNPIDACVEMIYKLKEKDLL